jgi:Ribbon-helix-helix protein, copG family
MLSIQAPILDALTNLSPDKPISSSTIFLLHDAVLCSSINLGGEMQRERKAGEKGKKPPRVVRASVSLRSELYRTLEALAKQKKVSTAWVLRDAAEKYVADQWPLLEEIPRESGH